MYMEPIDLFGDEVGLVQEIISDLYKYSSEQRCLHLCDLRYEPPRIFWRVFQKIWPICDATRKAGDEFYEMLIDVRGSRGYRFLSGIEKEFYESLPDPVTVYRGCSKREISDPGISWTTDPKVAASFAHGHRGIPVPEGTVMKMTVPKTWVMTVCMEREEHEVVVDAEGYLMFEEPQDPISIIEDWRERWL